MDDSQESNRNWYTKLLGMLLLFFTLVAPVACTMQRDRLIAEAIKSGVNPAVASCSFNASAHSPCLVNQLAK